MSDNSSQHDDLIDRAREGDSEALSELLELHRARLRRMVQARLNVRLRSRVDESDVIQDAYLEAAKRLPEYLAAPRAPFYLWLRQITSYKIIDIHRRHLGAQARDAGVEISLQRGRMPMASSISLAGQLLGRMTSPSGAAMRMETKIALEEGIQRMDEADREILSLRNFEELSNQEAALELGIEPAAASKRYIRALQRLQKILADLGIQA